MKRCGLYIRVSTDRQAKVEEGSLKNQDQLLTHHVEFKNKMNGEQWVIVERYIDEGKSAKDTKGRPAYLRMVEDVRHGKIDTVLCTALSRISRSTRDLLDMIEFFKQHGVDFICLKEDFYTTTAQGKCFITIMGALNEFEREQVGERTRTSILARASRGLWNGGQVLGYDLDPQRKGGLIVNSEEAKVVNFLYDTYLELGSVYETAARANQLGYRTKAYTGRKGIVHPAKPLAYTSVLWLLPSCTYIGKKEISKCRKGADPEKLPEELRYKLVDAVWPPIVDAEKFHRVQELLRLNHQHGRNGVKDTRHFYLLNGGRLKCLNCGSPMEGRSARGRRNIQYFYYACRNKGCRFKMTERAVEDSAQDVVLRALEQRGFLNRVVEKTNALLQQQLPKLQAQQREMQAQLASVNAQAHKLLERCTMLGDGELFAREELERLARQRRQIEDALQVLGMMVAETEARAFNREAIQSLLGSFEEVFQKDVKPYQRKVLLKWALERIELSPKQLKVGLKVRSAAHAIRPPVGDHPADLQLAVSPGSFRPVGLTTRQAVLFCGIPKMLF